MTHKTTSTFSEPGTIADRIYEQLKNDIIDGKLAQGSKIVEEDLAQKYGNSRGPLREAINRLEGQKLVVRTPRAGTRVVTLSRQMIADIYIVREALEGLSARLASELVNDEKIATLHQLLSQHEKAIEAADGNACIQNEDNLDFHLCIAEASGNQWLLETLFRNLYQLIRMCKHQSAKTSQHLSKELAEHKQILEAISQHDGELAEILMRRHISGCWKLIEELLPEGAYV